MPAIMTEQRNQLVLALLNSTFSSIKAVIPKQPVMSKPMLTTSHIKVEFGVLISFLGDVSGKLVIKGEPEIFSLISEAMFGMRLDGEMLASFTGELGNMIAGGLSTQLAEKNLKTDITSPTIMQGDASLSGFSKAIQVKVTYDQIGILDIHLLLD